MKFACLESLLEKYPFIKKHFSYVFLLGGFLFDMATLDRIDQTWSLVQQGVFLLLIVGVFVLRERVKNIKNRRVLAFLKTYHEYFLQFFMGGLLSAYTLFYFKSASSFTLISFVLVLVVLMFINEQTGLDEGRFPMRYAMMSLCMCSFMLYFIPICIGSVGLFAFVLSMVVSLLAYFLSMKLIIPVAQRKTPLARKKIFSGLMVPICFVFLYGFRLIPPVPLSVKKMGIYHHVEKKEGVYNLSYNRFPFLFWQRGAQDFYPMPGGENKIYFFASIFAPTELKHKIFVRWEKKSGNAWETSDRIPVKINGGRAQGYRAVTFKEHYSVGKWRVLLETQDDRELGRIYFQVHREADNSALFHYTEQF